ncbi:MAG: thiamine-phosphate kinase [Gemmatimonadetes bacterium]|nr:MAG: thiamine-phosphate kinase [Gemmatimonadota bacterium]
MTVNIPLGPGPEFDLLRAIVARYGQMAAGIGDDAATLRVPDGEQLVVSTDVAVEDVHFRATWLTPNEIGFRSATAALSDLAAMGAKPLGMVIALTLPPRRRAGAEALADGIARAARDCGAPIIGGDLSDGAVLAIAVTVLGSVARPLYRTGARPGDALWVTGQLGGSVLALRALLAGTVPAPAHRMRFAAPRARIAEAQWLAERGATAAIDISDGLAADASHIAAASGMRLTLDLDRVPCVDGATAADAAASGEEYELLIAGPADLDAAAFASRFGLPLTKVGGVASALPGAAGVDALQGGTPVALPAGFSHFQP